MLVLPKSLMVLGASVQSARVARRLKLARTAVPEQWQTFRTLVEQLALAEVGRSVGVAREMSYATFRANVPIRNYDQLAPHIDKMKRGTHNVLWPGQCELYATSAGTTGLTKSLPVTHEMQQHFRRATLASLYFYTARVRNSSVFRGRHLFLGGSTALTAIAKSKPFLAHFANLSGISTSAVPEAMQRHLYEPGSAIGAIPDWPTRLEATVARTRGLDVTLLAGTPNWLLLLLDALREGSPASSRNPSRSHALWPNLQCLVHSGVPLGPFHEELRQALGPTVRFHEVYSAAEGIIAAQDGEAAAGLRLLTDVGLFFEFIPLREFLESLPLGLGEKAVPLEAVHPGIDYVLLLTTPAGLCRYVLGDIVRFTSVESPRLCYVGRTELQLNAFGEHVIEKELTDTLVTVCNRHRWTIKNFHVAPIVVSSLTGQNRGRHEWWVELRPGTTETPTGPILAVELDRELLTKNEDYEARRRAGSLDSPVVRLVMPGLFRHWMTAKGKWGDLNKMPRCRSDRLIADELMAIACFTD